MFQEEDENLELEHRVLKHRKSNISLLLLSIISIYYKDHHLLGSAYPPNQ